MHKDATVLFSSFKSQLSVQSKATVRKTFLHKCVRVISFHLSYQAEAFQVVGFFVLLGFVCGVLFCLDSQSLIGKCKTKMN